MGNNSTAANSRVHNKMNVLVLTEMVPAVNTLEKYLPHIMGVNVPPYPQGVNTRTALS